MNRKTSKRHWPEEGSTFCCSFSPSLAQRSLDAGSPYDAKLAPDLRNSPAGALADVIVQFRSTPTNSDIADLEARGAKLKMVSRMYCCTRIIATGGAFADRESAFCQICLARSQDRRFAGIRGSERSAAISLFKVDGREPVSAWLSSTAGWQEIIRI